jgi:hypothetical protein
MNTRLLGIIGAVLVIVGIFCPLVHVSLSGVDITTSYFSTLTTGAGIDGAIVAGLGVISLIIALINLNRILIATGILTLGVVALDFFNFKSKMAELSTLSGDASFASGVSLQWGWIVLVLGGLVLIVAGIMKKSAPAPAMSYGAPPPGYPPGPGQPPPYNR